MQYKCAVFVAVIALSSFAAAVPSICTYSSCTPQSSSRHELIDFCKQHNGTLTDRCCTSNLNNSLIGLDLSNCGLTSFDFLQSNITNADRQSISLLLLDNNRDLKPAQEDYAYSFWNFTSLNLLTVPLALDCPGANFSAWNSTERNVTDRATICTIPVTYCASHSDACIELAEYPDNAYCVPRGPSLFECPCSPGYYGYKCLRSGDFPTAIFAPIVAVATVALSGGLWYTQRRFVIASPSAAVHQQ